MFFCDCRGILDSTLAPFGDNDFKTALKALTDRGLFADDQDLSAVFEMI